MNSPIGTVVVVTSPVQRPRQPGEVPDVVARVDGQRVGGGVRHRVPAQRVEHDGGAGRAVHQRGHELTLVDHPVEVGPRRGAGADIAERVAAVELLAARGQVDARQRIGDRLGGHIVTPPTASTSRANPSNPTSA